MRVLGIDPGLTRCGVAVVDGAPGRTPAAVHFGVVRTGADEPVEERLTALSAELALLVDEHQPDAIAIERVFSQHNVRTAMGTAQAAAMGLLLAGQRRIPVALHTPTEVKAAVTGSGRADKSQVTSMVTRILRLPGVRATVDLDHITRGYYSIKALNPTGIRPVGPAHVAALLEATR